MYRKLLRNITWLGAASIAVKPLWFIFVTAFCVRILGVSGYGVFTAALALAALTFSFTDLGLSKLTLREVARDHSRASAFFTNFLLVRLVLAIGATAAAVVAGILLNYSPMLLAAVLAACVYQTFQIVTGYSRLFYESFEVLKFEGLSVVIEKILVMTFGLALLYTLRVPGWVLAGMAAGMALTAVLNVGWVHHRLAPLSTDTLNYSFVGNTLRTAIPFGIAGIFSMFLFRVDNIMVEALLNETALGQYGLAFRIEEALHMLPLIVAQSAVFPRLTRLLEDSKLPEFRRLMSYTALGLGGASLIITVIVFLLAPTIIHLIQPGPEIDPAIPALKIICWTFPLHSIRLLLYMALLSLDDQTFLANVLGGAVAINVGLNFVLIPNMGINGAALATVVSEALLLGVYVLRFVLRQHRMSPRL